MGVEEEYEAQVPEVTGAQGKKQTEVKVAGGRGGDTSWGRMEKRVQSTPGQGTRPDVVLRVSTISRLRLAVASTFVSLLLPWRPSRRLSQSRAFKS